VDECEPLLLGKGVTKRVTDTLQPQRDCATVRLPAATGGGGAGLGGGAVYECTL
jgi:hypothetical protein